MSSHRPNAEPPAYTTPLPPRWLTWTEIPRALMALASLPLRSRLLAAAPRGKGEPVLVIPGFASGDGSTAVLRAYLRWLGYRPHGWQLGRNLGARTIGIHNERLIDRLIAVHRATGQPVRLLGWSMGGIMARMIARAEPERVAQVISLGAPFAGDPFANHAWRVYERMSGHSLRHPIAQAQIAESKLPMPLPAVSIYSRTDGIVAWQSCIEPARPHTGNIEVSSAHCGFGFAPQVLRAVADTLANPIEAGAARGASACQPSMRASTPSFLT